MRIFFIWSVVVFLFLGCDREPEVLVKNVLTEYETLERFFCKSNLKSINGNEQEEFTKKVMNDIRAYDDSVDFIGSFVENLGYPDWDRARWFKVDEETVIQIPVYQEGDVQTRALIIVAEQEGKIKCDLVVRGYFEDYEANKVPNLTVNKMIDLFILADFEVFGYSDYLPGGNVEYYAPVESNSKLKGWVMITMCYQLTVTIKDEIYSNRDECENWFEYFPDGDDFIGGSGGGVYTDLGGGNSGGSSSGSGGSIGDTTGGSSLPKIKSNLHLYPCGDKVLNRFTNFNSTVSNMLKSVFGVDHTVNITFNANSSLSGSQTDGTCLPVSSRNFTIHINPDVLNNATQEYIVVTYAHEAIHALMTYYKYNDPEKGKKLFPMFFDPRYPTSDPKNNNHLNELRNHETMANAYVDKMVEVIKAINPTFPESKARHLAWGGLHETWIYQMKKKSSLMDSNGNNIWEENVKLTNQSERSSSGIAVGTPC